MTGPSPSRPAEWVFGAAVLVHLAVLYAPDAPTPGGLPDGTDKIVHALVFAAVAWTGRWARLPVYVLAAALVLHAGLSEIIQASLLAARQGDVGDVLADLVGIGLGVLLPIRNRDVRT